MLSNRKPALACPSPLKAHPWISHSNRRTQGFCLCQGCGWGTASFGGRAREPSPCPGPTQSPDCTAFIPFPAGGPSPWTPPPATGPGPLLAARPLVGSQGSVPGPWSSLPLPPMPPPPRYELRDSEEKGRPPLLASLAKGPRSRRADIFLRFCFN